MNDSILGVHNHPSQTQMDSCSFLCTKCLQVFSSDEVFDNHQCKPNTKRQEAYVSSQEEPEPMESSVQESQSPTTVTYIGEILDARKENHYVPSTHPIQASHNHAEDRADSPSELEDVRYGENNSGEKIILKSKKRRQMMDDSYRLNRTMRDKDFKLARSYLYSFKDTLGDWDERSTQLLIRLIQKYPHTYFLLPITTEKRMAHWEKLHQEMETAGYNFTVLQLRMRWREVLQKYRWTVNHNDSHDVKKRCEYFDEMTELSGDWDDDATQALFRQINRVKQENQGKKIVRIGYNGWEKITTILNQEGYKYSIEKVEGRWRNLVTLYKTMIDHNTIPNVEPQTVAYQDDLKELVNYAPQRRNNYEKKVGRSVKIEKFPSSGCRILLQAYRDCMSRFVDPKIPNRTLWDEITQKLADEGLNFATTKLRGVLSGMIKGYEKCEYHNSLPGAIRRDLPHYKELGEIFGVYGRWPHIHISRTLEMKNMKKHRLRLKVSQQLWQKEESQMLLQVYPDVLEAHVNQCLNHQPSDLWLQVAKAYAATGCPKRDVPEIAVHIGLLRQGYVQNNKFPFIEEMRKVKEAEEAVCYSPDVSKYTGEVEIVYWSHDAVNLVLDLYIKYLSAAASSHASRNEVFVKIRDSMRDVGYKFATNEISEQFKFLLVQYKSRKTKPWELPPVGCGRHNPVGAPYLDKLQKVFELRREMSLSWTRGVKPLSPQVQKVLFEVGCQKADELLIEMSTDLEKQHLLVQIVDGIIFHIRKNQLIDPVPSLRQVRLHIIDTIENFDVAKEKNKDVLRLYNLFRDYDMLSLMCHLSLGAEIDTKTQHNPDRSLKFVRDSSINTNKGWISEEEEQLCYTRNEEKGDVASNYLALALCHVSKSRHQMNITSKGMTKLENSANIIGNIDTNSEDVPDVDILDSLDTKSLEVNDNDTNSSSNDSFKLLMETKDGITDDESEINSCNRNSTGTKDLQTDAMDEFYSNLFGSIHPALPKHCSRQSNNMLYTISSEADSNIRMLLPQELLLDVENGPVNQKKSSRKQRKNRTDKELHEESFMYSGSDSELNNEKGNFDDTELSDSVSQNSEHNNDAKIKQTRSGRKNRKTRSAFLSETLDYDFDDKFFEGSDSSSADVNSPSKRMKLESSGASSLKRKRRKPKKPQEAENHNQLKTNRSSHDLISSQLTNHFNIKRKQEKEFVKIMRDHLDEHSNILREICTILDKLKNKIIKPSNLGRNSHT